MMRTESPTNRAFWHLAELVRSEGYIDATVFALTWLAAGRMVTVGTAGVVTSIQQLAEVGAWKSLVEVGFPSGALDHGIAHRNSAIYEMGSRVAAARIVAELNQELGNHLWDVLPCLVGGGPRRSGTEGTVVAGLATLLLDLIGKPDNSELWIPFDFSGQLTVEAIRRGWRVLGASPMSTRTLIPQLLLTIEDGNPQHPKVRYDIDRDSSGRPMNRAGHVLAIPPFGVQVKESRMAMWDTNGHGFEQFARSESWAIHEFVNRTDKRAVFVTPQGVMFAKGQEQRLREYLLHRGGENNEVESVIALPPGVFGASSIAGAVLVVNPGGGTDGIYMADLGSGRRSLQEADDIVDAASATVLAQVLNDRARRVSREEIAANEYSLAPSRYLRRVADLGVGAVALGDICTSLRPPTTTKEPSSYEVAEVGMQDLNSWGPIKQALEKKVFLKGPPKAAGMVQPGDIVLSIKGTVGRAALMGSAAQLRPTVVSQSCLALRPFSERVIPQYLLMYLRSPHGQAQLEGLQVGAGVQHISPGTLLGSFRVPFPSLEIQRAACADYDRLCQLEDQVAQLQAEIADLTGQRWPTEEQPSSR